MCILFFIFFNSANSNLWDNIFGNFKSPNLIFPKNWQTTMNYRNDLITCKIYLSYSSKLGFFKANVQVDLFNTESYMNASDIILNLKEDLLYYHTPTSDCDIYQTPQLLQGAFNNSDMTNIWKMIAFYNGETNSGLKKFDVSGLISLINQEPTARIFTYFNKKSQLNFIQIETQGRTIVFDVKEKLKETEFPSNFFEIPPDWNCTNKLKQNLSDINTFGLESVLKDLMTENLVNTAEKYANGTDLSLKDENSTP